MLHLPRDYTRCMGVTPECPMRKECRRHCDIPENTVLSWARNLNPDQEKPCPYFVRNA